MVKRLREETVAAFERRRRQRIELNAARIRTEFRRFSVELGLSARVMNNRILARLADQNERAQEARRRREAESLRLPLYDIHHTNANGNLHTISYKPITSGGDRYSMAAAQENIATMIRTYTRTAIQTATHWTASQTNARIRGYLQITNTLNPQVTRKYSFVNLRELTYDKIQELFETLQQSETEIPFEAIEWTIVITPQSFEHGSGVGFNLSKKMRGELSWTDHEDDQGTVTLIRQNQLCCYSSYNCCISKQEL